MIISLRGHNLYETLSRPRNGGLRELSTLENLNMEEGWSIVRLCPLNNYMSATVVSYLLRRLAALKKVYKPI